MRRKKSNDKNFYFSYETALQLLNLTDKIPDEINLTVNYNYKFNQKLENVRIHHVNNAILNLGVIEKNKRR